jgi:hypothetical protein
MTNPNAAQALSLAADIRARIETGIIPYIAKDAETIAELLEGLAGEIEELRGGWKRSGPLTGDLRKRPAGSLRG